MAAPLKLKDELHRNGLDTGLTEHIQSAQAEVDLSRSHIEILYELSHLADTEKINMLKAATVAAFKSFRSVKMRIRYHTLQKDFTQQFVRFIPWIKEHMSQRLPLCTAFLGEDSDWALEEDTLTLPVAHEGIEFMQQEGVTLLRTLLLDSFNLTLSIQIKPVEALKRTEPAAVPSASGGRKRALGRERKTDKPSKEKGQKRVLTGKSIAKASDRIIDLDLDSALVAIEGDLMKALLREPRTGGKYYVLAFDITDYTSSVTCKMFPQAEDAEKLRGALFNKGKAKAGLRLRVRGHCQIDRYSNELVVLAKDINILPAETALDDAPHKRVELHLHTQMSTLDATTPVNRLFETAAQMGHAAVGITDHGVVQAFPDAYMASKRTGVKALFGLEAYLIGDGLSVGTDSTFVVFDIETTGLMPQKDAITEIGAVKIVGGDVIDTFASFVNPMRPIPQQITKLTGITDEMVQDAPETKQVLKEFLAFSKGCVLMAHNAPFDMGFINVFAKRAGLELDNPVVDTLELSRKLFSELKSHKLNILAKHLGIDMGSHHRAVDDARTTGQIWVACAKRLQEQGSQTVWARGSKTLIGGKEALYHIILYAKNEEGLKNLYRLVSYSHLENFYYRPRITRAVLNAHREGLIVGSACESGELYRAILSGAHEQELMNIAAYYDYLEIQPLGNNAFLVREGMLQDEKALQEINRHIVRLGEALDKPVIATGDVHFLKKEDEYFRRILMAGQKFSDADEQPPLYYRTTQEMLEEFQYLGAEKAKEVVIDNPHRIAESIAQLKPFPDETSPPKIEGAEQEVEEMSTARAHAVYGTPLPEIVQKRLDKELHSIITHGFAVLYLIAHKLVKKSLSDGYLVGSRGSVGSSFVAWLMDITEVNPLEPHYVCPGCRYCDFDVQSACGIDLPDRDCPSCGTRLLKTGYDIPFEVFLGFEGDKVPDIDLNFSGEYQSSAHKYVEELFGEGFVFRAGTIATLGDKNAYGYVMKYMESKNMHPSRAEVDRLVAGCSNTKRTTGQHPGGIIVVPRDRDIHEFTPLQRPADKRDSDVTTTHFDFNSLHDRLIKLDILGHDDPTSLRMLQDITHIDPQSIPQDDAATLSIFSSPEALGVTKEAINCEVGALGIPEFGTQFVRQMLMDTRPTTMAELIRISGLSHGTDVWLNNAQDLIRSRTATLSEVICTRDDIMNYLISKDVQPKDAFNIMENVRKGKGLTNEMEDAMRACDVAEWFIESCKKIKYMFPKAHAAAYVMMAFRVAYYKVHHKEAYYAVYFTVRADAFDASVMLDGKEKTMELILEISKKGNEASQKEKNMLTVLEVIHEMHARGLSFLPVDIYRSHATRFLIEEDGLRPPLCAMPGLGLSVAEKIVDAREKQKFLSREDLRERGSVSKTIMELLSAGGCLGDLPETNQLSLL
ncbi:MAG: PolC-type DNA polymerase III [Christensenellales bacterium]|jgi:DNA polymerase-3 subunit alpha (Gram-positive type)